MSTAIVFPGQGSQRVGMGKPFAEASAAAREVFSEADATLGFPLSRLCWEGPAEDLQLTANTQPAILATSVAILRALEEAGGASATVAAGHSLGEYSALVAAGTLELGEALRLVRRRGELMQDAVPVGEGAMAAILGLSSVAVRELAAEAAGSEVCAVANYNAPQQSVIAGHRSAVARAIELAKERGAPRSVLLPVSAPFHCALMAPVRRGMTPLLEAASFSDPSLPVVSNVDATPVRSGEAARQALIRQIDSAVRWVESVEWMASEASVSRVVEVGPGRVLSGLVRRIDRDLETVSLDAPADLARLGT